MTTLMHWISPSTLQSLGWALLHFLWQGGALAALAAGLMAVCRRASWRYALGVATLVLMLAAPTATFLFYSQQRVLVADNSTSLPNNVWVGVRNRVAAKRSVRGVSSAPSPDLLPWLVEAWLLGVAFFSLRSAGGLLLLAQQRRKQRTVVSPQVLAICRTLQERLGVKRAIQYCECTWMQAPAVIGWFRPIVLLPVSALTGLSEEQLQSVIAHELAHIKRLDPFVNVFQVCVETLLFYHPAVWWLNKRIRAEREHCCDETAVRLCGNAVEYARALTLMEEWRSAPALAMAANRGPLAERIVHLLGLNAARGAMRRVGFVGSIVFLGTALLAGNVLYGIAYPKPTVFARSNPIVHLFVAAATPQAQPAQQSGATPAAKPSAAQTTQHNESSASGESYIDAMKAAGLTDLTIDNLVGLKVQGVTPEYVRAIHDLGLHPDADGFIGLKVQGVTPEYIKEMRALGFNPDEDQIIGLKVQGVTPEYVHGMKEVGISGDADDMIGMKVQGVTPDYVRELRAAGLQVDANDVVGLKVQGVTPAYVQGLKQQGLNPDTDDIIGMRVQGVTPEYIRDIRALGLNPSADELVGMKVQGVTPEFIKALQAAGFKPSIDDIVGAKVQGVTPEFIERVKQHGFKDLTLEKVIELRRMGILDAKADL